MPRTTKVIPFPRRVTPTPAERAAFWRGVEHARAMGRARPIVRWFHERPRRSGGAVAVALLILTLTVTAAWAHAHLFGAAA